MKRQPGHARIKSAEVLSTTGAGVLDFGLGLLLARSWAAYALPTLALGAVSHLIGMYGKHRIEAAAESAAAPLWYRLLYWGCWLALLAGALIRVTAQGAPHA